MNQDQWFQNLVESGEEKKPSSYGWSAKDKTHNTTKEDLDAFLADSMAKLTVEERERELEQLHGCLPTDLLEDPLEIETKLKLLDHHLNSIKQGTVYEVAESMNRTFVSSRAFRITFLRADRYNPQEAVMRIIRFLEIKRSLFGTKKLVKKITLADLDKDDMECLKDGTYQILPVRDMAGRVVIIGFPHLGCKKPADNRSRASYYSIMTLIESEETQKRGISGVWYAVGTEKNLDTNRGILWNLPIFRAGVHICSHNQIAYILSADAIYRLPTEMRPRIRVHVGSHQECQNTLNSFGIPRAAIPLSDDNIPHVDNHLKWLEQRRAIEETGEQKEAAIVVTDADVLFGRGRPTAAHPGNKKFRTILEQKQRIYDQNDKAGRQDIATGIVQFIKENGSRFLKYGEMGWEEVSDTEARTKVTNVFRSQRKLAKKEVKTQ